MKLDKKNVEHIGNLARLGLDEAEKEQFATQLSSILEYVEKLQSVNTDGIIETAQVTGLENVTRADEVIAWSDAVKEALISAAPENEGRLVKTKPVF